MNKRFRSLVPACRSMLLAAALIVVAAACGRRQHAPVPPSAVPRPTTNFLMGGHLTTADLRLHARLPVPATGWM